MPVYNIFPEPVYFSKLKRALTKEELKTINFYKEKTHKNEGNVVSNDTYVLENKSFKNLKKDLNKIIRDYFNEIVCTSDSIIPYVTQSWLNYTIINITTVILIYLAYFILMLIKRLTKLHFINPIVQELF